jgi:SulP family sulfate permease
MTLPTPPSPPPGNVLHAIAAGATCGLLAIVQAIGLGSLLATGVPAFSLTAIGMSLLTSTIVAAITPLLSSSPSVVATTQGVSTVGLLGMLSGIEAAMTGAPTATLIATLVATVAVATLLIGVAALVLGLFRLGRFIRFTPFPVVAGFLAGSGWLILRGGLDVIAGQPALEALHHVDGALTWKFMAAAAFIAAVLAIGRMTSWRLLLPAMVATALLLFNGVTAVTAISTESLAAQGWLLALPVGAHLWPPITPNDFALIQWPALLSALEYLPSAGVLTVASLLMNATSIELDQRRDLDLDHELKVVGLANIVAGVGGGLPGFHSLSLTFLGGRLGGRGMAVGLTVAATCLVALVYGGTVLRAVPTPLLGAMLVWIGGSLLTEWLVRSYRRLSVWEYLVIILIFVVIAFAGFAWGLFVGVVAALMLFVVEYGRVDIVRLFVTGKDYQSSIDASEERRQTLSAHGDAILIMRLQGFLFFGTAERLRQRVEHRAVDGSTATHFVLIDFRRVTGLDSSTVLSFIRLGQTAAREDFTIVFTGVSETTRATMLRGGLDVGDDSPIRFVADLDAGLKWCEDQLIARTSPGYRPDAPRPLESHLGDILNDAAIAATVAAYCERIALPAGRVLIEQDTPSADIFFVEHGHASVSVASPGHAPVRLATVGPGAILGEVAFYLGERRSASVAAEEDMVVWRFSRESIERLQQERPDVGRRFHQGIAAMLAKRLTRTNHLVRLLAD